MATAARRDAAAPVEGGYGDDGMAKGGMVRPKRYAEGGIVERHDASRRPGATEGARVQAPEPRRSPPLAAGAMGGALAKGAADYKDPRRRQLRR